MTTKLRLISHELCPYVQRAVIVATEKGVAFERVDIDLANKPAWFLHISPTGKTPLLEVARPTGERAIIFESAVIAEFLDEISADPLLPAEPLDRARHRSWVEFASTTLNTIGQLYSARDLRAYEEACQHIAQKLQSLEGEIVGPFFAGSRFSLVDAAFAPAFRYLEVFRSRSDLDLLRSHPRVAAWAEHLLDRRSVRDAVPADYGGRLVRFVRNKGSYLGQILRDEQMAA